MMNTKTFRSIFACLIAMLLVIAMVPMTALAADDAAEVTTEENVLLSAPVEDEHEGHDHDDAETETEDKKLGLGFWISMGVLGALIIVGVVFAIIKREKLKVWLLSYKSELKKIVWSSKQDVKKNTIVVIVAVLAIAIVVGLLDFAFNKGIIALGKLNF